MGVVQVSRLEITQGKIFERQISSKTGNLGSTACIVVRIATPFNIRLAMEHFQPHNLR